MAVDYKACPDNDCEWDTAGEAADVGRAYKGHRKHHTAIKIDMDPNPSKPVK